MIPQAAQKLVMVPNWTTRPLMTAPSIIGRYVRVDPLDIERDTPLLWDALGGNSENCADMNERLKWYGMHDFEEEKDLVQLLETIEEKDGWCVNVFRTPLKPSDDNNSDMDQWSVTGMASYLATDPENGSTEVGYVAHGLAMAQTPASTEAHYLLAKHALETMGYRRYEWKCISLNLPSGAAALRYGFTFEGCFRQHRVTAKGWNRDTNWYSMLDSEWPQRKAAMEAWLSPSNFDDTGKQKQRLQSFQTPK